MYSIGYGLILDILKVPWNQNWSFLGVSINMLCYLYVSVLQNSDKINIWKI